MKALVKIAKGEGLVELRDVPTPSLPDDHVMIEVKAAGVCGTDVHIFHDEFPYYPPVILGHEFSGEVVETGANVKGWEIGERVVGEPHTKACGFCADCRMGNLHLCVHRRSIGWGIDGSFAPFLAMPAYLLHRIPDALSLDEAALAEPVAVATRAVLLRSKVEPGDTVVVHGPGPIGLLAAMMAKAGGASQVILFGMGADAQLRLPVAKQVGVDHVINVAELTDPVQMVRDLTAGRGADLVIEAAGVADTIVNSIRMVRREGRLAILGLTGKSKVEIPWDEAVVKACEVKFTFSTTYDSWARSLSMMASRTIDVRPLITRRFNLYDWLTAFQMSERKYAVKCLLIP
jgi:L-iditol 2-dehydrogenase